MTFTEPIEHAVMSSPKRSFLTTGSDPSRIRIRGRDKCYALTDIQRSSVSTETNEVFVTTPTESISV